MVDLLCKFLREETRILKETRVQCLVYEYPSRNWRCEGNEIEFQEGKELTNPFNNLRACFYSGRLDNLLSLYEENFQIKQKIISQLFKPVINITKKEKAIADWIDLIVEERLTLTVIHKKSFRNFYCGAEQLLFSQEKLKETLYNMVEIFEGRISAEMKDANRGLIPHNGWKNNGVIFFAIFACYINKVGTSSYSGVIE